MKNSGIEWIGEIPDSWHTLPLKRMVEKHFGGCWGEDAKNNDNDVLCIRIADFKFDNQSIKESAETMRSYTDAQIEKGLLKDGDLIVEKSGGGDKTPVGRVVIFDEEKFPQKAMFANFSECLRLKNTYSHRYIAYHLKSLYYSYDMHYYFHQTTGIQNLDMQEYLATMLCVPSVEQQQAVVEILDEKCGKIDELIANQQGQIEKLKEYKQSVITEAVTKGLDKSAPLKDSGIEWIGEIPAHWIKIKHKVLFKNVSIKGHGDATVLSLYRDYGVVPKDSRDDNHNVTSLDTDSYKYVQPNDLVINKMKAWSGSIAITDYEGIVSPAYYTCKVNYNYVTKRFIHHYLRNKHLVGLYEMYSAGLREGQWDLSIDDFQSIEIAIPPTLEEQDAIAIAIDEKCDSIDKLIAIKQEKIEKLQEYKKSLIYEYVTGKKEVV